MYYIADNELFEMMKHLENYSENIRALTETKFYLGLYKDISIIVRGEVEFNIIPEEYRETALEDIIQDTQISVYRKQYEFLNNPKSRYAGARVNYLKKIAHRRFIDWLDEHDDEIKSFSMEEKEAKYETVSDTFDARDYAFPAYRLAKYYVLFNKITKRTFPKICFLYKDIEMIVGKNNKNGGISGKHNVLERLNGRPVNDIRKEIFTEIEKICPIDIPQWYINDLKRLVWMDKCDSTFWMSYSYASSACSRIKDILEESEEEIFGMAREIINSFDVNHVYM